jgi:hypothetical protein
MSLVWYTTAELADGIIIDTNDYCYLNREALSRATPAARAVEDLLAYVRDVEFPKAPRRVCSVVAVPWPSHGYGKQGQGERFKKAAEYEALPEPPGQGVYCYRVAPGPNGQRWMVDEDLVDKLVRKWEGISEEESLDLAWAYWSGEIWHSISYLLSGEVRVIQRCAEPTFQ